MLKVDELKKKLNTTDSKGNKLSFDGKHLKITVEEVERDIGWIEMVDGKGLTYRKKELEKDRYRRLDAWSIPAIILDCVKWVQYVSDERSYEIDATIAKIYGSITKAKVNLEEKVYVPVRAWTIYKSKDAKEQGRLDKFGVEWYNRLYDIINSDSMSAISSFLAERKKVNKVYPKFEDLFQAFKETPYSKVRVVFMGNEPMEDEMGNGLAFSYELPFGSEPPISIIQDELEKEGMQNLIDFNPKTVFSVYGWATQGILLLNQCLSVEKGHKFTHEGIGWEDFTERVIREVQALNRPILFVLMGTRAFPYSRFIDETYHEVLKVDAYKKSFIGSDIFAKVDDFMQRQYKEKIKW